MLFLPVPGGRTSPLWEYSARRLPRPVRGAQIKTRNQPKGICPGKNGGTFIRLEDVRGVGVWSKQKEGEREGRETPWFFEAWVRREAEATVRYHENLSSPSPVSVSTRGRLSQ